MSDLTCTNGDLWLALAGPLGNGTGALNVLAARDGIPAVASYALLKARRKAGAELEDVEKARLALCAQFAEKDADGTPKLDEHGRFLLTDPAGFQAAWVALLKESVTLTGVRAVRLMELGDAKITADELAGLGVFLQDNLDDAA